MSESTIQAAFHKFNKLFAQELYHDHVHLPREGADQDKVIPPKKDPPSPPQLAPDVAMIS